MPVARETLGSIAMLRLDGDLFQSCLDILVNLYDKVSVGGYVIIDDWHGYPCKISTDLFRQILNITEKITLQKCAYWKKEKQVKFNPEDVWNEVVRLAKKAKKTGSFVKQGITPADRKVFVPDEMISAKPCLGCDRVRNQLNSLSSDTADLEKLRHRYIEKVKASVTGYDIMTEAGSWNDGKLTRCVQSLDVLHRLVIEIFHDQARGDIVDVGVWRGGSSIVAATLLTMFNQTTRKLFIVDSFRGVPSKNKTPRNDNVIPNVQVPADIFERSSVENVKNHLQRYFVYDQNRVKFGVLPPVLSDNDILALNVSEVSLIQLDAALLNGTVCTVVLESLYPVVSNPGGMVLVHNWHTNKTDCVSAVQKFRDRHGISQFIEFTSSPHSVFWKK